MRRLRGLLPRAIALGTGGVLLGALFAGTAGAQTGASGTSELDITVTATILEANAPASVAAVPVREDAEGRLAHGVRVTWNDTAPAVLDDERFTHHVQAQGGAGGDLVLAGRGCGASWSEQEREVIHPCTMDLRLIQLAPRESHEYPLWIYPELGPLSLQPGTYQVDQQVHWWRPNDEQARNHFTIRLTYEVTERTAPLDIAVEARIVESGAPASVAVTPVTHSGEQPAHGVRVTWNGSGRATLDDARFTHHVQAGSGEGDLVTAGRGCGASVADNGQVTHMCTADLLLVDLGPGETHEYPVRIYPQVGSLRLAPGTYVVDQPIGWEPAGGGTRQQFTVRLTYTVTEGAPEGRFTPEPAASGVTIASWSGGPASALPAARSYWVTVDGAYVAYVPAAPAFVNARFLAEFGQTIPAGTLMVVVR